MKQPEKKSVYRYEEIKPPDDLKEYLNKIWIFDSPGNSDIGSNFRILPDFTVSLIFISGEKPNKRGIFISGPNTVPVSIHHFNNQSTTGFRFKPAIVHRLFNILPSVSINKITPINAFISKAVLNKLKKNFFSAESNDDKIKVFSTFINKYSLIQDKNFKELLDAVEIIIRTKGKVKLEKIYSAIKISPRQFQRNFTAAAGLSPKEFCKIVRFHNVAEKLVKNNFRHFDALVETGYYDQSHYYREFKEFTGMLPSAFESRQKRISHKNLLD